MFVRNNLFLLILSKFGPRAQGLGPRADGGPDNGRTAEWAGAHGPGPWAKAHGPRHGPRPMDQDPWARAHGPWPKAQLLPSQPENYFSEM